MIKQKSMTNSLT